MIIESEKETSMDMEVASRPREMAYTKMEFLLRDMQHPETGIPVRTQKIFLTAVPCAFTGYDLVEWLMDRLDMEDSVEAVHLGNLLCRHGFFFPITDPTVLAVKDDGSLYRFQAPYYWPSLNWEPDDVEFSIYLSKRTMRNKQRHGLDENETGLYQKLEKVLCHKWDFIVMQANEQVRLAKDRRKADKVVLDSQERAFWRVWRPPAGSSACLESGTRRLCSPHFCPPRPPTVARLKAQIKVLEQALTRPKIKSSKAIDSLLFRVDQYREMDPLVSAVQPSNPWISDDTLFWAINQAVMEAVAEQRVKAWSFGIRELLGDPRGLKEFETFLSKEFSSENLSFWRRVEEFKFLPLSQVPAAAEAIWSEFLGPAAATEVNIDAKTMEKTRKAYSAPDWYTFTAAQDHIHQLMGKDSYSRFLKSEQYKALVASALTAANVTKKKLFSFGVGNTSKKKKVAPTTSPGLTARRGSGGSDSASSPNRQDPHSPTPGGNVTRSTGNLQDLGAAAHSPRADMYCTLDRPIVADAYIEFSSQLSGEKEQSICPWDGSNGAEASKATEPVNNVCPWEV